MSCARSGRWSSCAATGARAAGRSIGRWRRGRPPLRRATVRPILRRRRVSTFSGRTVLIVVSLSLRAWPWPRQIRCRSARPSGAARAGRNPARRAAGRRRRHDHAAQRVFGARHVPRRCRGDGRRSACRRWRNPVALPCGGAPLCPCLSTIDAYRVIRGRIRGALRLRLSAAALATRRVAALCIIASSLHSSSCYPSHQGNGYRRVSPLTI